MHGANIRNPAGERPFAGPLYGCLTPSGSGAGSTNKLGNSRRNHFHLDQRYHLTLKGSNLHSKKRWAVIHDPEGVEFQTNLDQRTNSLMVVEIISPRLAISSDPEGVEPP